MARRLGPERLAGRSADLTLAASSSWESSTPQPDGPDHN
jgi:hypothetical protein